MNDLTVYEGMQDMAVTRPPEAVLAEAKKAAQALRDVVATKPKPVMMNGEQYLEFEDWQTVGKFYGVTAKVITTEFIDFGDAKGFLAKAVAITPDALRVRNALEGIANLYKELYEGREEDLFENGAKQEEGSNE